MPQDLNNFDPIKFLSIKTDSLSEKDIEELRNGLNKSIGQYILLSFSEYFKEEEFEKLTSLKDGNEILLKLKQVIPNIDTQLMEKLENFKKEYEGIHQGGNHD